MDIVLPYLGGHALFPNINNKLIFILYLLTAIV